MICQASNVVELKFWRDLECLIGWQAACVIIRATLHHIETRLTILALMGAMSALSNAAEPVND